MELEVLEEVALRLPKAVAALVTANPMKAVEFLAAEANRIFHPMTAPNTETEDAARTVLLRQANTIITKDRAATHGGAEDSFATIAAYWNVYLQKEGIAMRALSPLDISIMMALFKVARLHNNKAHTDNWLDLIGYSAIAGEIAKCPIPQ